MSVHGTGEPIAAGYFEDAFSPSAFCAAKGVSVHSVVTISTKKKSQIIGKPASQDCSIFPVWSRLAKVFREKVVVYHIAVGRTIHKVSILETRQSRAD